MYAIPHPDTKLKRGSKYSASESSDSELESSSARKKKKSVSSELQSIMGELHNIHQEIAEMSHTLNDVSKAVSDITQVSKSMALPLSVVKLVGDSFRCTICLKQPMTPPIVAAKCCNILLGCASCVNQWYSGADGLDKCCPHCREPRGYASTSQFRGLDDFLIGMTSTFSPSPALDSDDESQE